MSFSNTYNPNAPTSKTGTGSAISNREDLSNVLTILAPEETPILSTTNKDRATATFTEWTVDSLDAPQTKGVADGADVTAYDDKFKNRARIGNYIQHFRKTFGVTTLQEALDSVGPANLANSEAKAMREIKRDIEATLMSDNDFSVEDGAGSTYGLRGLGDWIDSAGPSQVPSQYRTPADSIHSSGTFTETVFNELITSMYRVTGTTNNLMLIADTALRREISDFARISGSSDNSVRNVNYDGGSETIKVSVELYQSDHGIVSIVNMNPDCAPDTTNKDTGYLINPEYLKIGEHIPLGSTRTPNLGGGERGFVDCALTLKVLHPGAHGKITALS